MWSAAIATPANDLGLALARIERLAPPDIPTIGRATGLQGLDADLVLPVYGAASATGALPSRGTLARAHTRDGLGPLTLDRRAVMAFADTVELALDTSDADPATIGGA